MATNLTLKSATFRKEREEKWLELEALVTQVEKKGFQSLSADEVIRLQSLYRVSLSSLSVARHISLDQNVLIYLKALTARAYFCIYGPQTTLWGSLKTFFLQSFPEGVRRISKPIGLSALIFLAAALTGFSLTYTSPEWYYAFVSEGLAAGRDFSASPSELRAGLFDDSNADAGTLQHFASYLFTHNTGIGLLAFALGFAFGIPTILLLCVNGAMLGAFSALYVSKGLAVDVHGWLFIHGTTEILAIIICGGAGLAIGGAAIFPGRKTRQASLVTAGRQAAAVMMGMVLMFLVAGILEGFGRQWITDTSTRYLIGGTALTFWLSYFTLVGEKTRSE